MTVDEIANKYVGIPYRLHGRDHRGTDCWGLIVMIYRDLGRELWDLQDYDENWSSKGKNLFIENYHRQWTPVMTPQTFDVALFSNGSGVVNHAGVMVNQLQVIHTSKVGTIISTIDGKLQKRFAGFFRYKNEN